MSSTLSERQVSMNIWTVTLAEGVSRFGSHFQFFALSSLTYAVTRSPLLTALQMAVSSLPCLLFARWTGPIADRYDSRTIVGVTSVIQAALTLMYLVSHGIGYILTLNFMVAIAGAFGRPARMALMPQLVGRDRLLSANSRRAMIYSGIELLGPGLAGWALGWLGSDWAFTFNSISFLVPALAMLLVRPLAGEYRKPESDDRSAPSGGAALLEFLRWRPAFVRILIAQCAFTMGMWGVNALFFPFVVDVLHSGPAVMGWMVSGYYGAGLISGAVLERWGTPVRAPIVRLLVYCVGGVVWLGYTATPSIAFVLVLSVLDGIVFTLVMTLFETSVQEEAPRESIGRVSAGIAAISETSDVLGMVLGGWLGSTRGLISGFRVCALIPIVVSATVAASWMSGRLRAERAAQA